MKQEGKSRKKELKCWHYLWWQEFSLLFSVVGRDVVLRTKYNWCGNVLAQNESKNKKQNDNRQDGLTLEEIKGKLKIGEIYIKISVFVTTKTTDSNWHESKPSKNVQTRTELQGGH